MAVPASASHPNLQRGARGAEVKELQTLLNRTGALLVCDGAFGPGTEGALREAQQIGGLPVTGAADAATWDWLEEQPEPSQIMPTEAVTFIVREEVGSRPYYERHAAMPHFPGGASGVTIGVGYDLRFQEADDFEADWGDVLPAHSMAALRPYLGKRGSKTAVAELEQLRIPFRDAWKVFAARVLPRFIQQTEDRYGDLKALPPLCRGALVSLVYNRGPGISGDTRREMKAIRDHIRDDRLEQVAAEFESMKRLWRGSSGEGLRKRREKEAEMWRRGLQASA